MVAKHTETKALSFKLLSVDNWVQSVRKVERAIALSDIPANEADQYVVIKIPDSADIDDFWVALESAVTTISVVKSHRKINSGPVPNLEDKSVMKTETVKESFGNRNDHRLNQLKESILRDGPWLPAREVSERAGSGPDIKNPSAVPNRWKKARKIFAIPSEGKDLYPEYALDEGGQPLPVIKKILELFGVSKTPWSLAFWFGSPNSWLGSKKPKDLLATQPDAVYKAAEMEKAGPVHG